jgi:hypothetical protein
MSTMSCSEFANVASELALGVLYGEERAAALAHVESCRACRRELTLLTDAADEIRLIVPGVEPPAGFEQRVVARIAAAAAAEPDATSPTPLAPRRDPRHRRLVRPLAAVAAALLAFVAASAFVLGGGSGEDTAAARTAPMRTNAGEVVGAATLSTDPAAIRVVVPDWAGLVRSYGATVDATSGASHRPTSTRGLWSSTRSRAPSRPCPSWTTAEPSGAPPASTRNLGG